MYDFIVLHNGANGESNLMVPERERIPDPILNALSVHKMDSFTSKTYGGDHSGWWEHERFEPIISLAGILDFKWITTTVDDFSITLEVLRRTWADADFNWLIKDVMRGDVIIVRPLNENGIGVIYKGEVLLEPIRL